jgi:hypothetical protein
MSNTPTPPTESLSPKSGPPRDIVVWLGFSLKVIGTLLAITGAYVAYMTYSSSRKQDLATQERDVSERIFEQKLKVFDQAVSAAGDLVIAPHSQFDRQLDIFGVVTHGAANMVDDMDVYNAMVDVYNAGVDIYNHDKESDPSAREPLEKAFEALSETCGRKTRAELDFAGHGSP